MRNHIDLMRDLLQKFDYIYGCQISTSKALTRKNLN